MEIPPTRLPSPPHPGSLKVEYIDGVCRIVDGNRNPVPFESGPITISPGVWDDLRFPASGINPPGAASDPARSVTTGLLEFSGTVDNIIAGGAQMPHAWQGGSAIRPHLHLLFPTAAVSNTRWKLEWALSVPTGLRSAAYGSYSGSETITVANPNAATKHVPASFSPIDMADYDGASATIEWRLSRLAASDAADNHTGAVVLLELDFHYLSNTFGSVAEFGD